MYPSTLASCTLELDSSYAHTLVPAHSLCLKRSDELEYVPHVKV